MSNKNYQLNTPSSVNDSGTIINPSTEDKQDTIITAISDVTNANEYTGNKELRTFQENHICTDNTTTVNLGAGAVFTGIWQDALNYQEINVSIKSDVDSAINGLVFQWSADGVNIGDTDTYSYYASSGGTNYTPNPSFRYVRMVYTNGSQAQTSFSLMTILRRNMTGGSFHRIDSTLKDDSDARLNITVPKLKTAQNTYISQTATSAGNAKVSLEELESGVSVNNRTQLKITPFDSTGTEIVPATEAKQDSIIEKLQPSTDMEGGGKISVGTTAVEATFTGTPKSIIITADTANTGVLYVGKSNVTSAGANAIAFLDPGESLTLEYDDTTNALYVVASAASQNFWKGALL